MRRLLRLTAASMKMYLRQREALLWTLVLPLFVILLFGLVRFDGTSRLSLGVVNEAAAAGAPLLDSLRGIASLSIHEGTRDAEMGALAKGERDLVLVIPSGFAAGSAGEVYADVEARPAEAQLGRLLVERAVTGVRLGAMGVGEVVTLRPTAARHLRYIDFLVPGMIALSIMQLGIFGVAFGFVSLKKRGILRRLSVTPMRPREFIVAQVVTRVFVLVVQMGILLGLGTVIFDLRILGHPLLMVLLAVLGSVVFLSIGFALAGHASSEDQVAPIANIISVPMMLLSGVFFSRANLPGFVKPVTEVLPLTFLADGLRAVATEGAGIAGVFPQMLGLAVWGVVAVAVASRLFRWE